MANPGVAPRLAGMFFIQNLVWGAQLVLLPGHMDALGFSGEQISYVFGTGAVAALLSPLLVGWLADRFVPAQIYLGISYLLCGPLLYFCWLQTRFLPLCVGMLAYNVVHLPNLALTNAIAFHHMEDSRRFGSIRVWGSMGWIAVSWGLSLYLRYWEVQQPGVSRLGDGLLIGAVLAVGMGIYSLALPHTPPARHSGNPYAFLQAFGLLRQRSFAVLLLVSLAIAATAPLLFNFSFIFLVDNRAGAALSSSAANWVLSLGQVMEIPVMLGMGLLFQRLGMRWTLCIGLAAQMLRAGVLAWGEPVWLVAAAQSLNGVFITLFLIASSVAVERLAARDIRASAQGLLVFVHSGIGALGGQLIAGRVFDRYTAADGGHDWAAIFLVPALVAGAAGVLLALTYRESGAAGGVESLAPRRS